jgi:hypothetical protein
MLGGMEKTGDAAKPAFKQRRWPRAVWVKRVREFLDSGLSAEDYAAKKSIELKTLKSWIRVLQNSGEAMPKSARPAFLPVSVLHAVKAPAGSSTMMIEVDLVNGRRVRMHVKSDADFTRVSEMLDAVEGASRC